MLVSYQSLSRNVPVSNPVSHRKSVFGFRWLATSVASLAMLSCGVATAQTVQHEGKFQVHSILVTDDANAGDAHGANQEQPAQESVPTEDITSVGETADRLPTAPSAPQNILLPKTPNEASFTETQSNSAVGSESVQLPGDGSAAIGTFATENHFVRQPGEAPRPGQPKPRLVQQPTQPTQHQQKTGKLAPMVVPSLQVNPANSSSANGSGSGATSASQSIMNNDLRSTSASSNSNGSATSAPPQATAPPQPPVKPAVQTPPYVARQNPANTGNSAQASFGDQMKQPMVKQSPQTFGKQLPPQLPIQRFSQQTGNTNQALSSGKGFNAKPVDHSVMENRVQATGYNQSLNRSANGQRQSQRQTKPKRTELAKQLLERFLVDNAPDPLPGKPTKLIEMLRQPIPSSQRRAMVHQYWETYYDWSNFLSQAEYRSWLNSISVQNSSLESGLLNTAKSAANNRVLAAEIQLGKSQSRLMDFMPVQQSSGLLPLPADQPLIQKYNSNYDLYAQRGMIPTRLRGIDTMLPKTLDLIVQRAETVQLAKSAANSARNALANRQSNLATVLEAARIWREAERDLIATVVSYNQAIADYSLTITNGNQTPEKIVGMLIEKRKSPANSIPIRKTARNQLPPSQYLQQANRQYNQGQQNAGSNSSVISNQNFGPTGNRGGFGSQGQMRNASQNNQGFGVRNQAAQPSGQQNNAQPFNGSLQVNPTNQGNSFGQGNAFQNQPLRSANSNNGFGGQ